MWFVRAVLRKGRRGGSGGAEEIAGDPAFDSGFIAAPVPAVDLFQGLDFVPAFDGEDGGVEVLDEGEAAFAGGLKDFLGNVAVTAVVVFRPDPARPCAIGGADGDFIACLQGEGVGVFFLVVGGGGEVGHGWSLRHFGEFRGHCKPGRAEARTPDEPIGGDGFRRNAVAEFLLRKEEIDDGAGCGIPGLWKEPVSPRMVRMIPTPHEIFARFERGEIEREEMQALMALHARELIREMEEDHRNPVEALIEGLLARRAAAKLVRRHGGRLLREVFHALSQVPDFPPSRILWNALHPDVPLHCFLRIRREPVFRVARLERTADGFLVEVHHGRAKRGETSIQQFELRREPGWNLTVLR